MIMAWRLFCWIAVVALISPPKIIAKPLERPTPGEGEVLHRNLRRAKSPPTVPTAPLDPNENIHHTLDEVNSILGTLGGAASGAVMGLTGISITDCGLSFQQEDLNTITCSEFIDKLSECDSLSNLKPLLQQAKQKYRRKPNARAPCFGSKSSRGRHG